jgi:hypothetical protein
VRIRQIAAVALALVLCTLVPAAANAAGWEKISRDGLGNIDEATSELAGSSIVVAWNYEAPGIDSNEAVTFTSSLTDSVISPVTTPIITGWANLSSDPELVRAPDGSLLLAFSGTHSSTTGDPLDGLDLVARSAAGTWGQPVVIVPNGDAGYGIGALIGADGSPLLTGDCCGFAAFIFHGATNVGDAAAGLPSGSVTNRTLARDAAGNVWIAWYDLKSGVMVRQLDPATGVPLGAAPTAAPDSGSIYNNGSRIALACSPTGPGCRVVYHSTDSHKVLSWAPGESAPKVVATIGVDDSLGVLHAAYRSDNRLWVAWALSPGIGDPTVQFTLGDATGTGGQVYPVALKPLTSPYHLRIQPVGNDILLIGNFGSISAGSAQWADLVGIPAATVDTSGPKDVEVAPVSGGKGFRIQVQFKAPASCGARCAVQAELRNRTGTCSAACLASGGAKLPGDGKVIIGTRRGFKVPGQKKIRFYLTVSKAALLRTPFTTTGGYRLGQTRLRVWLSTPTGRVLVVRDGRIKVSIARIRSGALPGLAGIL